MNIQPPTEDATYWRQRCHRAEQDLAALRLAHQGREQVLTEQTTYWRDLCRAAEMDGRRRSEALRQAIGQAEQLYRDGIAPSAVLGALVETLRKIAEGQS